MVLIMHDSTSPISLLESTGAALPSSDLIDEAHSAFSQGATDIDITSVVSDWVSGTSANTGLAVTYTDGAGTTLPGV